MQTVNVDNRGAARGAPQPKLRLLHRVHNGQFHRAGMDYAIEALTPLWHPRGVLFDCMVESTFGWNPTPPIALPIAEPWIGIAHLPQAMPRGYFDHVHPQVYFSQPKFLDSLPTCRGLFAMSEYHAAWLRQFGAPVEVLLHPTSFDVPAFSFGRLRASPGRPLVHIGWWLRRFESFHTVRAVGYQKMIPSLPFGDAHQQLSRIPWDADVKMLGYITHDEYDDLLTRAVVFVDLMDCSANNVVLDCIARGTPLVINRHPAAAEYLGTDYPLFYNSIEHAEMLLQDDELLLQASMMMHSPEIRRRLTRGAFVVALASSQIYRSLPPCGESGDP